MPMTPRGPERSSSCTGIFTGSNNADLRMGIGKAGGPLEKIGSAR
jgi:hypothetical protein